MKFSQIYTLLFISFLSLILIFFKHIYIQNLRHILLIISVFCLGIFLFKIQQFDPPKISLNKKENLSFILDKKLNSTEKNRRYEVKFFKDKTDFNAVLTIPKTHSEIDFSHFYQGEVYIQKTEPPYADFIFNYQKYLARKNIFYVAYLPKILKQSSERKLSFLEKIKGERLRILDKISRSSLTEKSASFLKGIILADRTEMDAETVSDFQKSGLIHLLAISGTHIGIIFGVVFFIFLKIFPKRFRSQAIILSLVFIWCFALFIGLGNSVVRSCIMISTYMIYFLLRRKPDLLHALSLAGLIILIASPREIFDVGFQLSFSAVLGIYWLRKPILNKIPRSKYKAKRFIYGILAVTFAAQISTLPLVIFYFHQFSFISIFANLLIIPLAEIIITFSLFLAILLGLNFNNLYLNSFYDLVILNLLKLIHWFASLDFAMNSNIDVKIPEIILLILICYFLGNLLRKQSWKNSFYFSFSILLFIFVRILLNFNENKKSEIVTHHYFKSQFLSIKKDENVIFLIPENSQLPKIEKYIINPYLTVRRCKNYKVKVYQKNINFVQVDNKKYSVK
ncbi:ComEC/Rec2 family competence protein [Halpernia frigidisoli]|uniref:ComEC/Rec2 family competence protein n=1 Tax=Halpernia frigidisoli TaxID=1125876 RepID=UPI001F158B73|nr:ComEC/Rec2 family competence protein [Halpernia frigidisoli]